MQVQTFSKTRANFKAAIEAVTDRHEPLLITSTSGDVVLLSKEDYDGIKETLYLLKSYKNCKRLRDSIDQLNIVE